MAAPTHTAIPADEAAVGGIKLPNGVRSVLVFNRLATCRFYTTELKPGKIDGGDKIDTTTMLTSPAVRTAAPRFFREEGDSTVIAAYDPYMREQIRNDLINKPGSVTEYWSDGTYEDYYGYLKDADFSSNKEGEMPTVTLTVCKTNFDPVNKVVVAPVMVAVSGT